MKAKVFPPIFFPFLFFWSSHYQCLYTQEDRPCKRCSTAGKSCGPKTLARENDSTFRTQAESHKPQPIRSHVWPINKPLLPRILELVGPEMVSEVASKLASELDILHEIVQANPIFRAPSEANKDFIPRLPEIVVATSSNEGGSHGQLLPPFQRINRAVSLPPNPESIHSRPNEYNEQYQHQEERKTLIELPRIKVETRQDSYSNERRTLGDGIPQFQPYWYLSSSPLVFELKLNIFVAVNVPSTRVYKLEMQNLHLQHNLINIQDRFVASIILKQYNGHWVVVLIGGF